MPLPPRSELAAHTRRVLELSARHQLSFEYTAGDGWRLRDDLAVPFALTLDAELAITDDDAPIPLSVTG